jgi:protein-L-isoaspartate(D-aspartate) O-methyltransferase
MTAAVSDEVRRAFAEEVRAVAHLRSERLVEAYARVLRERFLGPGPWHIARPLDKVEPYRTTADADPRHIYHDVVVAIDVARQLNNGQPSSLALWIEAAEIELGEAVLHVGCGVGYYTAIMAELVGPTGRVVGYEIDPELAARAQELLAAWPNATVEASDGGEPRGTFDVIFVNAGATHVLPGWIAALGPRGRLIVPLTVHTPEYHQGVGAMLRIDRGDGRWPARVVSPVGIYDCANARDPACEAELMTAMRAGSARELQAIAIDPHERGPSCLAHLPGSCLQR